LDRQSWGRIVPLLAESFRVLSYDRRGHGGSPRDPQPYSVERDAADLIALLEAEDLFPAHFIGSSLGGIIALRAALDRPDLVRSVVVHEPPLLNLLDADDTERAAFERTADLVGAQVLAGDFRGAARRFVETLAALPGGWADLAPAVQESLVANAASWVNEAGMLTSDVVAPDALAEFDLPVLVTAGQQSLAVYRRIARALADQLPNSIHRELPGTGHLPHVTDPPLYLGVLLEFCLERNVPST
jgi:pimeloyl-ACP methyl ester carboxylesterase